MNDGGDNPRLRLRRDAVAAKRRAVATLAEPEADEVRLADIGREVAGILRRFSDDDDMWESLRSGQTRLATLHRSRRRDLRMAITLEWAPILGDLGYEPPPPLEAYADAFTRDLRHAVNASSRRPLDAADIDNMRARIAGMAERLGANADGVSGSGAGRLPRLRAGIRQAVPVITRAGLVAGVTGTVGLVAGPVLALGASAATAALVTEAAKSAAAAGLGLVLPASPAVNAGDGMLAFDVGIARLAHWTAPDRCGRHRADLELMARMPAGVRGRSSVFPRVLDRSIRWAVGGLAAALLVPDPPTDAGMELRSGLGAVADTHSQLVDALLTYEFDEAVRLLDTLNHQQEAIRRYYAHVVPDQTKEIYRERAKAGQEQNLDKQAVDRHRHQGPSQGKP